MHDPQEFCAMPVGAMLVGASHIIYVKELHTEFNILSQHAQLSNILDPDSFSRFGSRQALLMPVRSRRILMCDL